MLWYIILNVQLLVKKKIKTCKEIVNCDPSAGKSRKQNVLARILDVGLSRQWLPSSYYKCAQRIKGNLALRRKQRYNEGLHWWSSG